ncbi:MAG TPA: sulfocyanin-like copper-binding protein [Candidatus Dormibacteraeota bacterium]|nr:sulfocyanin-like copper-binding protein [Candidatus Dormibacteraeota bacterium]
MARTVRTVLLSVAALLMLAACSQGSGELQPGFNTSAPVPAGSGSSSTPTPSPSASPSPGVSPSPSPSTPSNQPASDLVIDSAKKSVTLKLVAAQTGANDGFNFDGAAKGQLVVSIPQGWSVTVDCSNNATMNHSCAIVGASSTSPAFPGAEGSNPTTGISKGQTQTFTFTASTPGTYRIACLIPGHISLGMWDTFKVVASGQPSETTSGS